MTIRQHEEVSGTPLHGHIIINDPVVSILLSDAVPKSHPHPIPDENLPRGFIDTYEDADEPALTHWRQTIGTNLVHEMGLKQAKAGTQFILASLPSNYKLYVHLKGEKDNPRKDYYLYGSRWAPPFRSPREFVFHAKWLAFGAPLGSNNKPLCACKYCSNNSQSEISRYLDDKVGTVPHLETRHHAASRSVRRRSHQGKEIQFKDYTRLNDVKPTLLRFKDEDS